LGKENRDIKYLSVLCCDPVLRHHVVWYRGIKVSEGYLQEQYFKVGLLVLYKGKAIHVLAWKGPQGSRKLRFQDFEKIDT
jgi:hypothetical protein